MIRVLDSTNKLYKVRFTDKEREMREKLWQVLCSGFLQKYIKHTDTVLDLAAGYCDFINNIDCKDKIAIDVNPDTKEFANKNVQVVLTSCVELPDALSGKVDVVFAGNLLEHLPSKDYILETFHEVKRVLKVGGKFLILNPNIRFSTSDYWDYFDHLTPVSDRSVVEGLELAGFEIDEVIPKFVPNTVKDSLPKNPLLVKIYLKLPFLFPIFGRQMFIVAKKTR